MTPNDKHVAIKNIFMAVLMAGGLFSAIVFFNNSWIKTVIVALVIINGVAWLALHNLLKRIAKYTILAVMIFAISFSTFEGYMLWNAGDSPTFGISQSGVTLSYPTILNVSLTEIVQSVKNASTFSFLMLEYPGEVKIETMTLHTIFGGGGVEVVFCQESSKLGFRFSTSNGGSYHAAVTRWSGVPFSQMYPQQQISDDVLRQIDNLGLQWYYDYVVGIYQDKTGVVPEINDLQVSVQWDNCVNYQGISLLLMGSCENSELGQSNNNVFIANFQPNGTLNYFECGN
ncbi:MAG: hypothetical protein FWH37_00010 [Candidatus Bathyarchaeota archaeon]|nr:hypothetical protein [Candidatus Termiticorpusculum sp.]